MFLKYLICFNLTITIVFSTNQCSSTKRSDIENHLATKTPYRVIANKNDKEIKYKDCVPTRIWGIIRHGTRNPSRKVINQAKYNLTKYRERILSSKNSNLCSHELAMFRNWSFNVDENEAKFLVYEGEDEMIELAERFQNRFPSLLPDTYTPFAYKFKYTATQRTLKSAESFTIGLFGRHKIKNIIYPEALHKDPILRFYKLCTRWRAEVDKNPDAMKEVYMFFGEIEMEKVIKSIKQRIGITALNPIDIHYMYTVCAYETAWNKQRISPWCYLFDRQTIRMMEFAEDLKYYWIDGYGYDLTYKQACPAVKDMIHHIRNYESPQSVEANVTFYFTHSGTLLKLLAHLGLYKDEYPLTSKDFSRPRKWRVSEIDAFGSNLIFVTHECADEPQVLVMHQERIVHLPGCPQNKDMCPLAIIQNIFKHSLENCNFDEMCHIPS